MLHQIVVRLQRRVKYVFGSFAELVAQAGQVLGVVVELLTIVFLLLQVLLNEVLRIILGLKIHQVLQLFVRHHHVALEAELNKLLLNLLEVPPQL